MKVSVFIGTSLDGFIARPNGDLDFLPEGEGGSAVLRSGGREEVQLEEVNADQRAPILRAYLQRAPGARPHIPVKKDASLEEFQRVAAAFPVFRLATNKMER